MSKSPVLLGRSMTTPVENKTRRVVVLPGKPSKDFILTAKCRIVSVGGRISMSAADLPNNPGGTYTWSTTSNNIRLVNTVGPILVVEGLSNPSSARDSELITVQRAGSDGSSTTKTVSLTVAKVTLGAEKEQTYGYDNFDTPHDPNDDHISVRSGDFTFVSVLIEGGAVGSDFDFVCDDPKICTCEPAPGSAKFPLRINAKPLRKASTALQVKGKCPAGSTFATTTVHVYSEKIVKVLVAKVADARSPGTTLKFPGADYAAHEMPANVKLKEAVVKYEISNFDSKNGVTNVPFDTFARGELAYDINAEGGPGFDMINQAVPSRDVDGYRVVMVRSMRSFYYLDRAAKKGDTTVSVQGDNLYIAEMPLGKGITAELVNITKSVGNVGYLAAPLVHDHAIGETLEFPAAAWANDPIIIAEGETSVQVACWTLLHEVGHTALDLKDVVDPTDFMHFDQSNSDYRLRYCPRQARYDPGLKENQWETIPRTELTKPTKK
jgi:hypothetical protein